MAKKPTPPIAKPPTLHPRPPHPTPTPPKPPVPTPHDTDPVSQQLNCTIHDPSGNPITAGTIVYTELVPDNDDGFRYGGRVEEDGRFIIRFPGCAQKGQGANLTVMTPGTTWSGRVVTPSEGSKEMGEEGGDTSIELKSTGTGGGGGGTAPFRREGIVRASGRSWIDDNGAFYPLGHTLFWAPRGWKFERERIIQNLQFLKGKGDYIRILGMVGWAGNEIDPTWPDYEQVMAELIDYCYDEVGLRVQITVTGGGPWNPTDCAQRIARIIPGREHKIAKFEAANESFNNGPDFDGLKTIGRIMRQAAPQNLVALSSPVGATPENIEPHMNGTNSNMVVLHLDRMNTDEGWRPVRQGWDVKSAHYPCSSNEPIGPASSVASESDPLRLAMNRATSVMCGAGDYVFHNGAGIYGRPNTPGTGVPRSANLWEMPNIDNIMLAVQRVTSILSPMIADWRAANDGWAPPNPVIPLTCTEWNSTTGPIKNYGARGGDQFVQMPHGIRTRFRAKATQGMEIKVYDPLSLMVVAEASLRGGEEIVLPAPSDNRQCAYIITGHTAPGTRVDQVDYLPDPANADR